MAFLLSTYGSLQHERPIELRPLSSRMRVSRVCHYGKSDELWTWQTKQTCQASGRSFAKLKPGFSSTPFYNPMPLFLTSAVALNLLRRNILL